MRHTNIVQIFDCIEDGHNVGLVMECVDGMDLKELNQRTIESGSRVPEGIVAYLAGQILSGLSYAHDHGIIHRDISPHNVLVSRQGEVKIADFGIASTLATFSVGSDTIKGKLAYMSPEQARAEKVDCRSDLFSTGLILYELLTGERFFPQTSRWQMIQFVAVPPRPTLEVGHPSLRALIEGLLEPRLEARLATTDEALTLLPAWASIGPTGALQLAALIDHLEQEQPISRGEMVNAPVQLGLTDTIAIGDHVPASIQQTPEEAAMTPQPSQERDTVPDLSPASSSPQPWSLPLQPQPLSPVAQPLLSSPPHQQWEQSQLPEVEPSPPPKPLEQAHHLGRSNEGSSRSGLMSPLGCLLALAFILTAMLALGLGVGAAFYFVEGW